MNLSTNKINSNYIDYNVLNRNLNIYKISIIYFILFFYFNEFREIRNKIIFIISLKRNIYIKDREISRKLFLLNKRRINQIIFVFFIKNDDEIILFLLLSPFLNNERAR